MPPDPVSIEGEIPEAVVIGRLDPASLPAGWRETRNESLRRFGDDWVRRGETASLLVPAAAIHGESNVLLNPAHGDFDKIRSNSPEPIVFDA